MSDCATWKQIQSNWPSISWPSFQLSKVPWTFKNSSRGLHFINYKRCACKSRTKQGDERARARPGPSGWLEADVLNYDRRTFFYRYHAALALALRRQQRRAVALDVVNNWRLCPLSLFSLLCYFSAPLERRRREGRRNHKNKTTSWYLAAQHERAMAL